MVKFAGIDLAAREKNPTGICIINDDLFLDTVYKDDEILEFIHSMTPNIVAIDAPIMANPRMRDADRELKKYGAMPPSMPSMAELSRRAWNLSKKIGVQVIEVFSTATAKIIGVYSRDYREMALKLQINAKNRHEVDAYLAAYTAKLWWNGRAVEVGSKEKIIIPKTF